MVIRRRASPFSQGWLNVKTLPLSLVWIDDAGVYNTGDRLLPFGGWSDHFMNVYPVGLFVAAATNTGGVALYR